MMQHRRVGLWVLAVIVVLLVVSSLFLLRSAPSKRTDSSPHLTTNSSGGGESHPSGQVHASAHLDGDSYPQNAQKSTLRSTTTASMLSNVGNAEELLRQAGRTQDEALRAFAVYMPSALCASLLQLRNGGLMTMKSAVPENSRAVDGEAVGRIAQLCDEYLRNSDPLRGALLRELKSSNAPMAAFFSAYKVERASNDGLDESRRQLARVLESNDPTALQPLALVWAGRNAESYAAELAPDARSYAQNIASAAFDIAICRSGAACGAGSIQRDIICTKYGECGATDVETAYRRLHENVGLSFSDTDRLATSLQEAIRRGDTRRLWP